MSEKKTLALSTSERNTERATVAPCAKNRCFLYEMTSKDKAVDGEIFVNLNTNSGTQANTIFTVLFLLHLINETQKSKPFFQIN